MWKASACAAASLMAFACLAYAQTPAQSAQQYQRLARDIFQELVEIKSTESGVGSTPAAQSVARRLISAGFPTADVQVIGPNERKKNLVAHLHGKRASRPILLLAHLDVVEAHREDWSPDLDPFKFVERDGYFYGRGTQDIKDGAAILTANFIRWKQEGWVPERDLILALTADEEIGGDANGVKWLLENHRELIDAEYCLNTDAGDFRSRGGSPYIVALAAAEKKSTALQLQTTNRGGHGSLPRRDNAIYELAAALVRLSKLDFPVMLSEVTRAQLERMAMLESGQLAADMKAVAQNANDLAAVARLSENPFYNALLRTTCVAAQVEGGHATNALPQRATAVLNCRILPGHDPEDVLLTVKHVIADEQIEVKWKYLEPRNWPASPLRPELLATMEKIAKELWPGVSVVPVLETGGSDGRFLSGNGIPTYGLSGVFIDQGDERMHGRDERIRVRDFYGGLEFYNRFVRALAGRPGGA